MWIQRMLMPILVCSLAAIVQGCVTVHAPLVADAEYPDAWGKPVPLGEECKALGGSYVNEGRITSVNGVSQPLLLTSVLNFHSNAKFVSLNVRTQRLDQYGDAFITLDVVPDDNLADLHEFKGCYCIKQTLACTQVSETYWSFPNFGLGGSQRNVYFALSQDRSLIAKLQNYHADIMFAVPIWGMKEPWARFVRTEQ